MLPELAIQPFTESHDLGPDAQPVGPGTLAGRLERRRRGGGRGAGWCGVAHASDGGGSIRIPAACCGLFGLKPQRGRVSPMPDPQHWYGLSVFGCVSRSVIDSALFLDVVRGPAEGDAHARREPVMPFAAAARTARRGCGSRGRPSRSSPARWPRSVRERVARDRRAPARPRPRRRASRTRAGGFSCPPSCPLPARDQGRRRAVAAPRAAGGPHPLPGAVRRRDQRPPRYDARWPRRQSMRERLGQTFEAFDVLMTPTLARLPQGSASWEGRGTVWTINGVGALHPVHHAVERDRPARGCRAGRLQPGGPAALGPADRAPERRDDAPRAGRRARGGRPWADRKPPIS